MSRVCRAVDVWSAVQYEIECERARLRRRTRRAGALEQDGLLAGALEQDGLLAGALKQGGLLAGALKQGGLLAGVLEQGGLLAGALEGGGLVDLVRPCESADL